MASLAYASLIEPNQEQVTVETTEVVSDLT